MTAIDASLAPVQLVDAYLYDVALTRSPASDPGLDGPTLAVALREDLHAEPDGHRFAAVIEADVTLPYNDGRAVARLKCAVSGMFASETELPVEEMERFVRTAGVVILYPYLRSTTGQIWRMTGLAAPPLPTLDVLATMSSLEENASEGAKTSEGRETGTSEPSVRKRRSRGSRTVWPAESEKPPAEAGG